jgi:serine/threonine protein kinase/tetratricopeptide (TPR) repeat protein
LLTSFDLSRDISVSENHHDDDKTHTHVPLLKDTAVGRYRIIEKIGAGGMGEVYLAQDTELDRKVALKFLPQHLCQDEDCRARFKREAQAAAKLSHPNIVTIHEVGEHQTRPYFVMEHVEGRALRDVKAEELDIDRIIGIAIQLCDGLHSAHAAGVTHRDIKPSNIIIDSSSRPKLLDFGLATVKGSEHLTKTGSTLGTIGYMSPEQIEGKVTDARSDLFSLGVVLYELIANKSPFRRDDETATLKAILQDTAEPLARYKSDVPDDLQRIITKLLEKDPALRYQSATGVIPDLKKLSAASTASVPIERKRDRWNRYVVPSAVVILLAVVAIWYFSDHRGESSESDDKIRLAVLPFENLGDPRNEYFADGITEAITSRLCTVHGLGVISRTSADLYKDSPKSLRQIAEELQVDFILEGKVQWDRTDKGDRVRITPQLIDASDDSHVWSDAYHRFVTDVFAVQTDIAEHVAEVLGIALATSEREALDYQPTKNIEAYQHYIRGRQARHAFRLREAERELTEALRLEPEFALAHAELARSLAKASQYFPKESADLQLRARKSGLRALELAPHLREAHLSMAYYYYRIHRDYDRALEEISLAQEGLPSNSEVFFLEGLIRRRQALWDESLSLVNRAIALDPFNPDYIATQKVTCIWTRKYDEALRFLDRAISSQPEVTRYTIYRAQVLAARDGYTPAIASLLDSLVNNFDDPGEDYWSFGTVFDLVAFDILARSFESALGKMWAVRPPESDTSLLINWYATIGEVYYYDHQGSLSHTYAMLAKVVLSTAVSDEVVLQCTRNLAHYSAMSGRDDEARKYISDALASPLLERDMMALMYTKRVIALTLCRIGDAERALDYLAELLQYPSDVSIYSLRDHPDYDPLRDHPRFQALIKKYDTAK